MKKKYQRPKNLNELALMLSEIFADVPNKELEKGDAKIMIGAATGLINISKINAIQNEAAIRGGQIDLMQIEFGKFQPVKKELKQ